MVTLRGHFALPVTIEDVRPLRSGYELRVRISDGSLEETTVSKDEVDALLKDDGIEPEPMEPVDAELIRLLIESTRIRLAYSHDRQFAVSLSGIQTLPHQIEAVYMRMLPQPRLRFLLADDPGAGKTIMAGLLVKELKLREAIDRTLILCPSPLTIQWQDEMSRWFGETFNIISSMEDKYQLVNPWERSQVISSIDYAKQPDVRERVWQQHWDLIIIDEAHKCSAYTKSSRGGYEVKETKRYQLAKRLAEDSDQLLLLTATPHHGDEDRFAHFIRLLDPDIFPEPHRLKKKSTEIRKRIFSMGPDCPWALRRLKEDLRDMDGMPLFPDRHVKSIKFKLTADEYALYKTVSAYINEFLSRATGPRKHSAALTRTVFQRRLASSTRAIHESLKRRLNKQETLLEELRALTPSERRKKLLALQGRISDAEQDDDDLDDKARDELMDEYTAAEDMDQIADEVSALKEIAEQARRVRERAMDSKLTALKECLALAEFSELKDGRGKLLIFTEHKDTLHHVKEHLEQWGYSTCKIHGSMNARDRRIAQETFRTSVQVCVATEAAGEGINLQFCHLMINYDMPWNPTRLEQRLGRIHRIGQKLDVYAFNFVATESEEGQPIIEGRILERLLAKLDIMREALHDRVFDIIGEVLAINDVNLPEMMRDAATDPRRLEEYIDKIDRIDPDKLKQYEDATGIALARRNVDFSAFQSANFEVEERRLMPKYVETQFLNSATVIGLNLEPRADGMWRARHVPALLRDDRLESIRKLGKPESSYNKLTFYKEHLEQAAHQDAVLIGPGHCIYMAVDELLNRKLQDLQGRTAVFLDPMSQAPYMLHFFEMSIIGMNSTGRQVTVHAETIALREEEGALEIVSPDILLNLPAHPNPPENVEECDINNAIDHIKDTHQITIRGQCREERSRYADVCRDYLTRSFDARIRAAQDKVMSLRARERESADFKLARTRAEQWLADLEQSKRARLSALSCLEIARPGPVRHIASALVLAPDASVEEQMSGLVGEPTVELRRRIELAAEDIVVAHEEERGRDCTRVGHQKIGFDIRSIGPPDPNTGICEVRRIEVKGRARGQPVRLTTNEWYNATQLKDTYWLYVVWDPLSDDSELKIIHNPAKALDHAKKEVQATRFYDIPADAIEQAATRRDPST